MGKKDVAREKKGVQYKRIYELLTKYSQIIVVSLMNVGSRQVQDIRRTLMKSHSYLLIGKNTLIRRVLQTRVAELEKSNPFYDELNKFGGPIKELDSLRNLLTGKVGLIFSDIPVFELKPIIEANKVETQARVGALAPIDVFIPPGPTGMDPSQISFFHALSISTKIEKGQIQITKDFQVCFKGQKVTNSQAALLSKLGKKPFFYGMEVLSCYDSGSILNKNQVSVNLNDVLAAFTKNASNITALSLGTGIVTEASVPHMILSAFKNIAALGIQTGYEFEQLKGASSSPQQVQQPQGQQKQAPAPVQEAPKVEEKVVEEDLDMGGLFD